MSKRLTRDEIEQLEIKSLSFAWEFKLEDGDEGTFTGLASTFGNRDLVGDIIERGAFAKSLKRRPADKIKLLHQHSTDKVLGVLEEAEETQRGLKIKGRLALGTQLGAETLELLRMGALDALSIGFSVPKGGAVFDDDRGVRILKEIDLFEISIVTFPANERARITGVKEIGPEDIKTKREFEDALRDAGFSHSTVAYLAANWQPPALRDGGGDLSELLASIKRAGMELAKK